KPVAKLMERWTGSAGYPLLSVAVKKDNGKDMSLELSQQRFYSSAASATASRDRTVWQLPVSVLDAVQKNVGQDVLSAPAKTFGIRATDQLKLNAGETGFYRVQYDETLLARLAGPVGKKQL